MSKLIRVSEEAFARINHIAKQTGFSKQHIIDEAIEKLERETILMSANQAYELRRKDPKTCQEDQEEIDLWDSALFDGLEDE